MRTSLTKKLRGSPRGSALLLAVIVLGTLALLAAAGLRLAQQESVTVNQRIHHQTLIACAQAAEKKLWAEVAVRGTGSGVKVKPTVIPGANTRLSIGHYDEDPSDITEVALDDNFRPLEAAAASGGIEENDATNNMRMGGLFGQPYLMVAHCTDVRGRQYEVELLVRWL